MSKGQSIENLNNMSPTEFQKIFRNVVENCPQAAIEVSSRRPFRCTNQLVEHFHNYITSLDHATVLRFHPDLAAKLAEYEELTVESAEEQNGVGLNRISSEQREQFNRMNEKYKEKFGFPFIICVRETNKIEAMLRGFTLRIENDRNVEMKLGMDEVKKICRFRIGQIIDLE